MTMQQRGSSVKIRKTPAIVVNIGVISVVISVSMRFEEGRAEGKSCGWVICC